MSATAARAWAQGWQTPIMCPPGPTAAMKAIIAAGPGALGQLEELTASTDPKLAKIGANLSQQIKRKPPGFWAVWWVAPQKRTLTPKNRSSAPAFAGP